MVFCPYDRVDAEGEIVLLTVKDVPVVRAMWELDDKVFSKDIFELNGLSDPGFLLRHRPFREWFSCSPFS